MSFQKPPLGTRINWTHPLSRDLKAVYLFNEYTGTKIKDLVNGNDGIAISGPVWSGEGLKFDGTSDYVNITKNSGSNPNMDIFGTGISIIVRCNYTGGSADNTTLVSDRSGNDNNYGFRTTKPGGGDPPRKLELLWNDGGGFNAYNTDDDLAFPQDGVFRTAAVTYDEVVNPILYVNGKVKPGTLISGALDALTAETPDVKIGGNDDVANRWHGGTFEFVYIWKRPLAQSEVEWASLEPYAMLERRLQQRVFFIPAVAAGHAGVLVNGIRLRSKLQGLVA